MNIEHSQFDSDTTEAYINWRRNQENKWKNRIEIHLAIKDVYNRRAVPRGRPRGSGILQQKTIEAIIKAGPGASVLFDELWYDMQNKGLGSTKGNYRSTTINTLIRQGYIMEVNDNEYRLTVSQ